MSKKFKLCPKIDTGLADYAKLSKYVRSNLEIQLIGKVDKVDLVSLLKQVNVPNIVLHASNVAYDICEIVRSEEQQGYIREFLADAVKAVNEGFKIRFLFHCGWSRFDVTNSEICAYLKKLYEEFKIPILLENTIELGEYDRAVKVVNLMHAPYVSLCLDMSHVRAIINQGINYKRYFKGINSCKHIHMSYSSCGDGYRNLATHGVTHPSKDTIMEDVSILEEFNIGGITMCPEVMEVGNMYYTREQERREIKKLLQANVVVV